MKFLLFQLVTSSILISAIAFDFNKAIKNLNKDTIFLHKNISSSDTNGNLLISTPTDNPAFIAHFIQIKERNNCDLIHTTNNSNRITIPFWTNHKAEFAIDSILKNHYDHQVHEITSHYLEQIDGVKNTRIGWRYMDTNNINGDPPNFVSTIKRNVSLSLNLSLSTTSDVKKSGNIFSKTANERILIETLEFVGFYPYYKNVELEATFLNLPLLFENTSMTIVVPDNIEGFHKLEQQFDHVLSTQDYKTTLVSVSLPLFSIENEVNLRRIFDKKDDSDGNRFRTNSSITLDKDNTLKRPKVDYDESVPKKEFKANRPFIFYVKINDLIVFIGRVHSPKELYDSKDPQTAEKLINLKNKNNMLPSSSSKYYHPSVLMFTFFGFIFIASGTIKCN